MWNFMQIDICYFESTHISFDFIASFIAKFDECGVNLCSMHPVKLPVYNFFVISIIESVPCSSHRGANSVVLLHFVLKCHITYLLCKLNQRFSWKCLQSITSFICPPTCFLCAHLLFGIECVAQSLFIHLQIVFLYGTGTSRNFYQNL
jgi:hypothetical protein